jgi:hypothetical protein
MSADKSGDLGAIYVQGHQPHDLSLAARRHGHDHANGPCPTRSGSLDLFSPPPVECLATAAGAVGWDPLILAVEDSSC